MASPRSTSSARHSDHASVRTASLEPRGPVHAPERRIGGAPVGELPGHEAPGVAVLLDPRPLRRLHQMMVAAQLPDAPRAAHAAGIAIVDARRRDLRRPGARPDRCASRAGAHGVLAREEHHATLARCARLLLETRQRGGELGAHRVAPGLRRDKRRERAAQRIAQCGAPRLGEPRPRLAPGARRLPPLRPLLFEAPAHLRRAHRAQPVPPPREAVEAAHDQRRGAGTVSRGAR